MKWCLGTETPDTVGHPMTTRSVSFVLDVQASRKWLDNPPRVDLLSILSVKHELRPQQPASSADQFLRLSALKDCGSGSLVPPSHQYWEMEEMNSFKCQTELHRAQTRGCHLMHHLIKLRPGGNKSKEAGYFLPKWQLRGGCHLAITRVEHSWWSEIRSEIMMLLRQLSYALKNQRL